MLFTDGFTNQPSLPTTVVNDQDDAVPAAIPVNGSATVAVTGLTPGQPWPPPYREDPTGQRQQFGLRLRDELLGDRPATRDADERGRPAQRDPASWPHLNFAAMSLGTEGKLPAGNQSTVEAAALTAGTSAMAASRIRTCTSPTFPASTIFGTRPINGRGRFVNAQSADELKLGMGQILQDVDQSGGRARRCGIPEHDAVGVQRLSSTARRSSRAGVPV